MKKIKMILILLVIAIIVAISLIVVLFGNKIAITNKSKISMGMAKTMNAFFNADEIEERNAYKYLENYCKEPTDIESKISAKVEVENLDNLVGEEKAEIIDKLLKDISNSDITFKMSLDSEDKKATMKLNLNAKDIIGTISGDVAFTNEELAFRSKELNEEYLIINKEDSEEYESLFELYDGFFNVSKLKFSKEDITYLKETYQTIFKDFITDDMMKSEKSSFYVNGNSKSCSKEILTLENDQIKDLLKKYVDTYKNDSRSREIIENKIVDIYGEDYGEKMKTQINDAIDEIEDAIDEIEDTKFEFVTYCSLFEVYGTEIILTIDGESNKLVQEFNDNETKCTLIESEKEVANFVIKKENKEYKISGTYDVEYNSADFEFVISDSKIQLSGILYEDGEKFGNFKISYDFDIKKDTENEFENDMKLKVALDISDMIKGNIVLNINDKVTIGNPVDYPNLDDAVSLMNEKKLEKYYSDCKDSLMKYMEKFEQSNFYKGIEELTYSSIYDIEDDIEDDIELDDDMDTEMLNYDIKSWFEDLEYDEDLTLTQIVEKNMIKTSDFTDKVSLKVYTSWEEGEELDEGYLKLKVKLDDETYEFYVDIADGTIYTEDIVPSELEEIEWNMYK